MNLKLGLPLVLFALTSCLGGTTPAAQPTPGEYKSYVEPRLWTLEAKTLSVIVTGKDWEAAARAVERVDGQVISKLWLIDAVSAEIPADRLADLAADPEVISVVANKGVKSAQAPQGDSWATGHDIPVPWDGSLDVQPTAEATV